MDGSQFDAWTRRRFGVAVGGGLAALLSLSEREVLAVKGKGKGKKKKGKGKKKPPRCNLPVKAACERGNSRQCCKDEGAICDESVFFQGTHCCHPAQGPCTDADECCGDSICDDVDGLDGLRCCGASGRSCTGPQDCCEGFACNTETDECE